MVKAGPVRPRSLLDFSFIDRRSQQEGLACSGYQQGEDPLLRPAAVARQVGNVHWLCHIGQVNAFFIRSLGIMQTQGRLLAKEMPEEELSRERDNFESVEERALFSGFNHINVLDPYLETRDRLDNNFENPRPNSIFIVQSQQAKLVYCNRAFRSWTGCAGMTKRSGNT